VFSIFLLCPPGQEEQLIAELWEAGTQGMVEEPGGWRAFFAESVEPATLLERFQGFAPQARDEPTDDWEHLTREAWPPMAIGERFFLVAPWNRDPTPEGRLRLSIEPGMACGTGRHPCTQLCLEALERHMRPEDAVLDVGTGSGILSAAASLLGAGRVVACDTDPDAVRIARDRLGGCIFAGSADAVRSGWADLIVANISSSAIEELAPEFARVRRKPGTLIISGFEEWDLPEGFEPRETLRRDGWACLVC
jgi:ribosomal protein L11 methyltransferase